MDYQENFDQAEKYYMCGNYQKALILFQQANEIGSTNNCENYIGCCYIKLGEHFSAIKVFETLIEKCPDWSRPVYNLGRAYLKTDNNEKALELFKRATTIDPNDSDAYYYLGVYYEKIKDYETAIDYYKKSIKINDSESEAHLNLGVCYMRQQLYKDALFEFEQAYINDNNCQDALYNQGLAYESLGSYEKALEKFQLLYELNPQDIQCMLDIMLCYYKINDLKNAILWNKKVLDKEPENKVAQKASKKLLSL